MSFGIGVTIRMLSGNSETVEAMQKSIGKTIASASVTDTDLVLTFDDGSKLTLADQGQSCCESRYMRTDDNVADFAGAKLTGAEIKEAPSVPDEYVAHDVQFLVVHTDKGDLTCSSHNEHNGYYGGFRIEASYTEASA